MPHFHETLRGRKFYEADVPRLIAALERIASQLEIANQRDKGALNAESESTRERQNEH